MFYLRILVQFVGNLRGHRLLTGVAIAGMCASIAGASSGVAAPGAQSRGARGWRPAGCPPPPESTGGPSRITVTGPCAFQHTGEAECEAEFDDFLIKVRRPGRNKSELMLYINIERYVGPGSYKGANDMWVALKEGSKIYRWSTAEYNAVVGPGSKSVTFRNVRLEPEPVLVGCTGPHDNFQCDGRGDEDALMDTIATVSGTIYCKTAPRKR